jgi:serine/threonine protein phosphatase PrpC
LNSVYKTDIGKIRTHNEDNGGIFPHPSGAILALIADGMGGHLAGEVASEIASRTLLGRWENAPHFSVPTEAEVWLTEAINVANNLVLEHAMTHSSCEGMGTTLVAAICTERFATVANIGDSRGYILNEMGLAQVTNDHTLVNELVRSGQITEEDAEYHPRKNVILKALGTHPSIEPDIHTLTFEENDLIFLCSDGLSDKISKEAIQSFLTSEQSLEKQAELMIELANENGGEDNISLAIIKYDLEYGSR